MTSSIILTGMPGCGKSTVGKALARELAVDFCDTDDLIVSNSGERLQDTIDNCGRDAFLELERKTILSFSPEEPLVISTGGSVVLHEDVMMHLKELGTVVFLDADLPLIRKRLWNLDSRGIIFSEGKEDILEVYREREPLYYRYSDIRIHINHRRTNDIVREIIRRTQKR
ncbi:MAG: shikimate kinase [Clostridiales bacterium]|nr:shikimate kinase [Clostridiales bacterium]